MPLRRRRRGEGHTAIVRVGQNKKPEEERILFLFGLSSIEGRVAKVCRTPPGGGVRAAGRDVGPRRAGRKGARSAPEDSGGAVFAQAVRTQRRAPSRPRCSKGPAASGERPVRRDRRRGAEPWATRRRQGQLVGGGADAQMGDGLGGADSRPASPPEHLAAESAGLLPMVDMRPPPNWPRGAGPNGVQGGRRARSRGALCHSGERPGAAARGPPQAGLVGFAHFPSGFSNRRPTRRVPAAASVVNRPRGGEQQFAVHRLRVGKVGRGTGRRAPGKAVLARRGRGRFVGTGRGASEGSRSAPADPEPSYPPARGFGAARHARPTGSPSTGEVPPPSRAAAAVSGHVSRTAD